jgi:DNA-binding beta-propeller fold protein YncE
MSRVSRRDVLSGSVRGVGLAALASLIPRGAIAIPIQDKGPPPYPIAVTVGNNGTIFVADKGIKTIYKVEEGGKLTVVYKGSRKYRTPLFNVFALSQDSAGNLFFCDTGSMDVWRMTPDGKLSPLTGQKIARGIGPAPENQDFDPDGAYAGDFDKPMGIVIDPEGNPVVTDLGLGAVFRIPAGGGKPQEFAKVPAPHGIALDRDGGFVVVSQSKDQLVRVSAKGEVTPIVKGPLAPKNNPHNVVVDQAGFIVSDNYAKAIWRVSPDGKVKAIVQGEPLVSPVGLALEADSNILVADPHAKQLFRVTPDGKISTVASFAPDDDAR